MRVSEAAWCGISASILAYEVLAPKDELLSDQTDRWRQTRLGRLAVHGLVWTIAGHLTRTIPEDLDWLHQLGKLKR